MILEVELSSWGPDNFPRFIAAEDSWSMAQNAFIRDHVAIWKQQAQRVARVGLCLDLEDGPDVPDKQQDTQDHGEELEGMHTPEISSLEEARIGRPGAWSQVRGRGVNRFMPAMFE
jgi:hypothetical protein